MRIWNQSLIPHLCTRHLVACWREALGAYKIITNPSIKSYRNHPATREYINTPETLHSILTIIKKESIKRGFNFKNVPTLVFYGGEAKPWQTIEQQINIIISKQCACDTISMLTLIN